MGNYYIHKLTLTCLHVAKGSGQDTYSLVAVIKGFAQSYKVARIRF